MKQIKVACLVIVLIGSITSNSVSARDGGHGGGFVGGHYGGHYGGYYGGGWGYGHRGYYSGIGLGLGLGYGLGYYGGHYYPPYYGYPPAVIAVPVPVTPPVYIQQPPPAVQQYPSGYWYYCNSPEGYYPYIKECPNGWQQVEPTPPTLR